MSREPPPGRWPGTGEPFIALATVHCVLSDITATEALHASQLLDEQMNTLLGHGGHDVSPAAHWCSSTLCGLSMQDCM